LFSESLSYIINSLNQYPHDLMISVSVYLSLYLSVYVFLSIP